jgi:hypothetical protein
MEVPPLMPRRGARPTPDLQHMTLQVLSLSAAVLTVRAYVKLASVPQCIAQPGAGADGH